MTKAKKIYYVATEEFKLFLLSINGKISKLALDARITARTIHRIKSGERTNTASARDIHKASCKTDYGYIGEFDSAFVLFVDN